MLARILGIQINLFYEVVIRVFEYIIIIADSSGYMFYPPQVMG